MEVGIITIHNHDNHGAALQAFALNFSVRKLGHQCKTIDCNIDPGMYRPYTRARHPGEHYKNLYLACRRKANRLFRQRFIDFIHQHIPVTKTIYETIEQLTIDPPCFDAFITGSDQVWNPELMERRGIGDAFHLSFASPERSRLISYAPSFGVTDIPRPYVEKTKNYLQRYHFLSVREKRGQEIIFELTGRKAEQVLDPTLLLSEEDYEPVMKPTSVTGDYILVYPMEVGDKQGFLKLVKEVKNRLALPVVCVLPLYFGFQWLFVADKIILDAGPMEFLGLFKNASFVCTNGFHGTAFSIIYRKNFLGFPHSSSNIRILSLLERVGLLNRQLSDVCACNICDALEKSIDYKVVAPCLHESVQLSRTFLKNSLES